MFPRLFDHLHETGRQKNSLSFKERARVRMGSTDPNNSSHPRIATAVAEV